MITVDYRDSPFPYWFSKNSRIMQHLYTDKKFRRNIDYKSTSYSRFIKTLKPVYSDVVENLFVYRCGISVQVELYAELESWCAAHVNNCLFDFCARTVHFTQQEEFALYQLTWT